MGIVRAYNLVWLGPEYQENLWIIIVKEISQINFQFILILVQYQYNDSYCLVQQYPTQRDRVTGQLSKSHQ